MRAHVAYDIRDSLVARKKHLNYVLRPDHRTYGCHRTTGIRGGQEPGWNNDRSLESCTVPGVRDEYVNWQMPWASHACVEGVLGVVMNHPPRFQVCRGEMKPTELGKGSWIRIQPVAVVTELDQTPRTAPERLWGWGRVHGPPWD